MTRQIRLRAVRRDEIDINKLVLAVLRLARAKVADDVRAHDERANGSDLDADEAEDGRPDRHAASGEPREGGPS